MIFIFIILILIKIFIINIINEIPFKFYKKYKKDSIN